MKQLQLQNGQSLPLPSSTIMNSIDVTTSTLPTTTDKDQNTTMTDGPTPTQPQQQSQQTQFRQSTIFPTLTSTSISSTPNTSNQANNSTLHTLSLSTLIDFPPLPEGGIGGNLAAHQRFHEEQRRKRQYDQRVNGIYQPLYTTIPPHPYYIFAHNDSDVDKEVHDQLVKPYPLTGDFNHNHDFRNDPNQHLYGGSSPALSLASSHLSTASSMEDIPSISSRMTTTQQTRPRGGSNASSGYGTGGGGKTSVGGSRGGSSWFDDPSTPPPTQHQPPRPPVGSSLYGSPRQRPVAGQPLPPPPSFSSHPMNDDDGDSNGDDHFSLSTISAAESSTTTTTTIPTLTTAATIEPIIPIQDHQPLIEPQPRKFLYHIVDIEQFPDQFSNEIIAATNPLKHAAFTSIYGSLYTQQYDNLAASASPSSLIAQAYFGTPIAIDSPSVKPSSHRQQRPMLGDSTMNEGDETMWDGGCALPPRMYGSIFNSTPQQQTNNNILTTTSNNNNQHNEMPNFSLTPSSTKAAMDDACQDGNNSPSPQQPIATQFKSGNM